MKLEPVFLLAPEPEPPAPRGVSRRTLVLAVASALGLGSLGTLGVQRALLRDTPLDDADEALIRLAERLQDGPIEELVRGRHTFLHVVTGFPMDPMRWRRGLTRLADAVLDVSSPLLDATVRIALANELLAVASDSHGASALDAARCDRLRALAR